MKNIPARDTNPLEPQYQVPDQSNNLVTIGQIEKNKPKPPQISNAPDFMNNIKDIEGTSSVRFFNRNLMFHVSDLPKYKATNNTGDIQGAQPCSKKKGIVSNRSTNPLNPRYHYPGHS